MAHLVEPVEHNARADVKLAREAILARPRSLTMRQEIEVDIVGDGDQVTSGIMLEMHLTNEGTWNAWVYMSATGRKAWVPVSQIRWLSEQTLRPLMTGRGEDAPRVAVPSAEACSANATVCKTVGLPRPR